jgi:hypothetical protein
MEPARVKPAAATSREYWTEWAIYENDELDEKQSGVPVRKEPQREGPDPLTRLRVQFAAGMGRGNS